VLNSQIFGTMITRVGQRIATTNLDILAEFHSRRRTRDTPATWIRPTCIQDCRRSDTECHTRNPP